MVDRARRLLVCLVVLPLLIAALTACSVVTPIPGNAPNPSPPPAPGTATEITQTINGVAYVGLKEWSGLILDGRLEYPLFVAYTQLPQWRPVAQAAAIRKTLYSVAPTPEGVIAMYVVNGPNKGRIVVNPKVLDQPIDVLTATIVHETYHASHRTDPGPAACLAEEMHAFAWEAQAYDTIVRPDGIETNLTREEDDLVALWHAGRIQERVLLNEGYQRECLGGVVQ